MFQKVVFMVLKKITLFLTAIMVNIYKVFIITDTILSLQATTPSWGNSEWESLKGTVGEKEQDTGPRLLSEVKVKVSQLCPTLCDPMNYIVHGILQARILEWVVYPFSSGSSWRRNRTRVSCIAGGFFANWVVRKPLDFWSTY